MSSQVQSRSNRPLPIPSTPSREASGSAAQPVKAPTSAPAAGDRFVSSRQQRYELVADLVASRIYVVNKATGQPVDRYLTSPGTSKYPTQGDHFVIQRTLTKAPWNPPKSPWAKNAKPVPGGQNNPMGIFKMDLGGYSEYIHGTPASERKDLGHPASHGCLRMSNENVLQLYQRYAGVGTEVTLLRDPAKSQQLREAFEAQGLKDHAITDGAELLPAAIAGKPPAPIDWRPEAPGA
ncbi:MAG TPA: L,D-transpeptidase [Stenomitos sp.]